MEFRQIEPFSAVPAPVEHQPTRPRRPAAVSHLPITDPLTPTIFHEAWWLDAAAPGTWSEVTVQAGGRTVGRMPFLLRRESLGRAACVMPELTHFLGPAVEAGNGAPCNRALKVAQITRELLEQLPPAGFFNQRMHRGVEDVLVFAEQGYQTLVQFTFEIAPEAPDRIWANMRDKTRNIICRAEERHELADCLSPAAFAAYYTANVENSGHGSYYLEADIARVTEAALARNRGRIIAARTPEGRIAGAIFCVWDQSTCYYLLSTRDKGVDQGATSQLIWEAIRHAAGLGLTFDFDGLLTKGNRVFFTGFGGAIRPRYVAWRKTRSYRMTTHLANLYHRLGG